MASLTHGNRLQVDAAGSAEVVPIRPYLVSRSGRNHESGTLASVSVEYRPGQGRTALRLLAGVMLRLILDVRARP